MLARLSCQHNPPTPHSTSYGLAATLWCRDGSKAQQVARALQVATVWVNCWMVRDLNMPFGGVKESGMGRESATESIEFFTEAKTICVKWA